MVTWFFSRGLVNRSRHDASVYLSVSSRSTFSSRSLRKGEAVVIGIGGSSSWGKCDQYRRLSYEHVHNWTGRSPAGFRGPGSSSLLNLELLDLFVEKLQLLADVQSFHRNLNALHSTSQRPDEILAVPSAGEYEHFIANHVPVVCRQE